MRFPWDRGRFVAVLTSVACVAAVVIGATVATSTLAPAVAFAQTGHWVVNAAESTVVHVDGGTRQVDAQVRLASDVGDPLFALQGETQGFVVGADRIAVFGRSTLRVDSTIPVEFAEVPVGIETVGGPYLVYREAGTIVRLGVPPLSLPVGGRVDRPVWTDDGTVWVHRPDDGSLCAVRAGADALDCSATTGPGEPGALTVTAGLPAFLATRPDAVEVIAAGRLGAPVGVGADVPDEALVADRDTEGRLAVVEPVGNRLVLTDSGGVPDGRAGGAAVVVELGPGRFTSPLAADGVIAVLDEATNRLLTFDATGRRLGTVDLPPGAAPQLVRGGDGRIYVDDADGAATHVVGADGSVTSVGTGGVAPELVAVAAPPGRSSAVIPPPSSSTGPVPRPGTSTRPVLPGTSPIGPMPQGPGPGPPQPIPAPPDVRPVVPAAPQGVTARIDADGSATVGWQPVTGGAPVTYTVRSAGAVVGTTPGTSLTGLSLVPGVSTTFTVQAAFGATTGPESGPSNAVTAVGRPGTPTNLRAGVEVENSVGDEYRVSWARPALAGGVLDRYEVTATDSAGAEIFRDSTAQESIAGIQTYFCEVPADVTVRAVTVGPDRAEYPGEPARLSVGRLPDCGMDGEVTATLTGDRQIYTEYRLTKGVPFARGGSCELLVNGAVSDSSACSIDVGSGTKTHDDLDPDTSYTFQLVMYPPAGAPTTRSATVTVVTPPDDTACAAVEPRPEGCP